MEFRQFLLLNELRIHKLNKRPDMFVAFRGHLWLFDDSLSKEEMEKIFDTIQDEHPQTIDLFSRGFNDVWDFTDRIGESIPDSFVGRWDGKKRTIIRSYSSPSPVSSSLVKKVVDALGARSVSYDDAVYHGGDYDDRQVKYTKKQIFGIMPDTVFHGTSTKHLPGIFKLGLKAAESKTNYPVVTHYDKVFFDTQFANAEDHAAHTTTMVGGFPTVIEFKIPDKDLLVPDYDVDLTATGPSTYGVDKNKYSWASVDPMKASKHTGTFGYRGRIPASFIQSIYLRLPTKELKKGFTQPQYGPSQEIMKPVYKWKKVRIDVLRRRMAEDPWEWHYNYGLYEE